MDQGSFWRGVKVNQGWFVDEGTREIGTKIYGEGILVSTIDSTGEVIHLFEAF